jgi:plasmid stabilization system protein ParE
LKVTYTEEALADIVDAIAYLNERNPTAAAKLDREMAHCVERLADREFEGPLSRDFARVLSCEVGLLIVRVYHQARRPITR